MFLYGYASILCTIAMIPTEAQRLTSLQPIYQPPASTTSYPLKTTNTEPKSGETTTPQTPTTTSISTTTTSTRQNTDRYAEDTEYYNIKANQEEKVNTNHHHTSLTKENEVSETRNDVASQDSYFASVSTMPIVTSIGAALLLGGFAYYSMPSTPDFSKRSGPFDNIFDKGVRVVHPSDLSKEERERIFNAAAFKVRQRSFSDVEEKTTHPYVGLATRFYNFVMPSFVTGQYSEAIDKAFDVQRQVTKTVKKEKKKKHQTHPYHQIVKGHLMQ